jgi:DNA-binding CsgD family transcriptional regulator
MSVKDSSQEEQAEARRLVKLNIMSLMPADLKTAYLAALGRTQMMIAEARGISPFTVRNSMTRIREVMDIRKVIELRPYIDLIREVAHEKGIPLT